MDETLNDDTLSERPTLGRTVPEEKEPEGPARTWTDEDAERETLKRPVSPEEMTLAGRYKVLRRLGEGGMGSVWLAEDLKLDSRKVAIKMLPAVLAGKKAAYKQVKQEALMAMKLSHPNIATVRAFEEEDGNPFLVMDYIEGQGLDDILAEKGKLSEEETLRLLTPVAAALDYAHAQGVVHRDVKSGNVIVRKDGTPFLLDFGIAREIQESVTRVTGKFSSGTLLYMSPEQLRGRAPKAAQDVYSFAVVAYECLTGRPPFYRGAVEDQIKNEPPGELEERVASKVLRDGIMAGLAKEPEGRPRTCADVLGGAAESNCSVTRVLPNHAPKESISKTAEEDGQRQMSAGEELGISEWYCFRTWIAWNIDSKVVCFFYVFWMSKLSSNIMESVTTKLVALCALCASPLLIVGLYFVFKYISKVLLKPANKRRKFQNPTAAALSVNPRDCRNAYIVFLLCYVLLIGAEYLVGCLLGDNMGVNSYRVVEILMIGGSVISYLLFRRLAVERMLTSVRKQLAATNGYTNES